MCVCLFFTILTTSAIKSLERNVGAFGKGVLYFHGYDRRKKSRIQKDGAGAACDDGWSQKIRIKIQTP